MFLLPNVVLIQQGREKRPGEALRANAAFRQLTLAVHCASKKTVFDVLILHVFLCALWRWHSALRKAKPPSKHGRIRERKLNHLLSSKQGAGPVWCLVAKRLMKQVTNDDKKAMWVGLIKRARELRGNYTRSIAASSFTIHVSSAVNCCLSKGSVLTRMIQICLFEDSGALRMSCIKKLVATFAVDDPDDLTLLSHYQWRDRETVVLPFFVPCRGKPKTLGKCFGMACPV